MVCPQCNVEYRPGFTHCADCGVDLVNEPPHHALASQPPADPGDPNEDPYCSFWKGEDARVHAELCEVLEEAGVPHKTVFRRDHLFNLSNFPGYEVGVPFSLFEKAEKAVQEAFGTEDANDPEAQELPGLVTRPSSSVAMLPESVISPDEETAGPRDPGEEAEEYPGDLTKQVWQTEAAEPSEFLVAALRENGISCRVEEQGPHATLYVLPHDAERAREIVREVVEGQPPE